MAVAQNVNDITSNGGISSTLLLPQCYYVANKQSYHRCNVLFKYSSLPQIPVTSYLAFMTTIHSHWHTALNNKQTSTCCINSWHVPLSPSVTPNRFRFLSLPDGVRHSFSRPWQHSSEQSSKNISAQWTDNDDTQQCTVMHTSAQCTDSDDTQHSSAQWCTPQHSGQTATIHSTAVHSDAHLSTVYSTQRTTSSDGHDWWKHYWSFSVNNQQWLHLVHNGLSTTQFTATIPQRYLQQTAEMTLKVIEGQRQCHYSAGHYVTSC